MFGFLNEMTHLIYNLLITGETRFCVLHSDEMNTEKTSAMLFFACAQGVLSRFSEYLASGDDCLKSGLTA